ncbi:MAG: RluA family pseudouridine synthase [Candidatus Levybacteria bacterium]|nr:RluA family pseudouridine synthase [Candidatus Levybacteria bacterium]
MLNPKIIYEDESIIVLDKPAGLTVNRSDTTKGEQTLQDWVEGRGTAAHQAHVSVAARSTISENRNDSSSLSENSQEGSLQSAGEFSVAPESDLTSQQSEYEEANREAFYKRGGIVHRLDKETSGIILVAKKEADFLSLLSQFKERKVEKKYIALVHGKLTPSKGEISVPVGRLPWNRKRFGVVAGGRDAKTHYKVLRYYKWGDEVLSLLKLYPETGRTHQIRVHLKYMNSPIFADSLYGGRKTSREDRKQLKRQFLHASSIRFTHPKSSQPLSFKSPMPGELGDLLSKMQAL